MLQIVRIALKNCSSYIILYLKYSFGRTQAPLPNFILILQILPAENSSSDYQDRPILVDVKHKSNSFLKIQNRFASTNLTRLIKPVAAALLFAIIFYVFAMPNAHAIALADIYNAVAKVTNVHMTSFEPDKSNPTWQQWVSESLKLDIIKTSDQIVFWDINNHLKKTRNLITGNIETNSFSNGTALQLSQTMAKTVGLLPFKELTDIPENAEMGKNRNR